MNPHPNPHRATLDQTIEAGPNIIRLLNEHAEAEAQTPTPATAENLAQIAAAFAQAHRAVRRGILLAQSLDAPAEAKPTRTATRARVIRAIEDQIGDKPTRPPPSASTPNPANASTARTSKPTSSPARQTRSSPTSSATSACKASPATASSAAPLPTPPSPQPGPLAAKPTT